MAFLRKQYGAIEVRITFLLCALTAIATWNIAGWRYGERESKLRLSYAASAALQVERAREIEISLREKISEIEQENEKINADLSTASSDANGLRLQVAALLRKPRHPASSSECSATEARAGVLAGLLEESDRMAGIYAELADRSTLAGHACEQAYNAVLSGTGAKSKYK